MIRIKHNIRCSAKFFIIYNSSVISLLFEPIRKPLAKLPRRFVILFKITGKSFVLSGFFLNIVVIKPKAYVNCGGKGNIVCVTIRYHTELFSVKNGKVIVRSVIYEHKPPFLVPHFAVLEEFLLCFGKLPALGIDAH